MIRNPTPTARPSKAGCFFFRDQAPQDWRSPRPGGPAFDGGQERRAQRGLLDSRTLQSTPESGGRAGFDGAKVHAPVDTLGHLLALKVTAANEQDHAQVGDLARALQEATDGNVKPAYVDQGDTGEKPATAATEHGLRLEVVKPHEAKRGFVLSPRRWVVERSFAWAARFRRLALRRSSKPGDWIAARCRSIRDVCFQISCAGRHSNVTARSPSRCCLKFKRTLLMEPQ